MDSARPGQMVCRFDEENMILLAIYVVRKDLPELAAPEDRTH